MMAALRDRRLVWLAIGALVGGAFGVMWPQRQLHAVATDRLDNFAIATGHLDDETEAIFFLNFLTGELRASALSPVVRKFFASFHANVVADLQIDLAMNPKFMMVTGESIFRINGGQFQPGHAVVYVAEMTSGRVAAYAVPWSEPLAKGGRPVKAPLILLDTMAFRAPPVDGT